MNWATVTIETTEANQIYGLRFEGKFRNNVGDIFWGDGTSVGTIDADTKEYSHTYEKAGLYTLVIEGAYGTLTKTDFSVIFGAINGHLVKSISGDFSVTTQTYANCSSLKTIPEIKDFMLEEVSNGLGGVTDEININNLCYNCKSLEYADINASDYGNVVYFNASNIFFGCENLKQVILQSVRDISGDSFSGCNSLEKVSLYYVKNIAPRIFFGLPALKEIYCVGAADFPESACEECRLLESLTVDGVLTVSKNSFYNCTKLKEINASEMNIVGSSIFYNCINLETLGVSKITLDGGGQYQAIFYNNKKIKQFPLIEHFDASTVQNYSNAFRDCISLTTIPFTFNFSVYGEESVIMDNMYKNCVNMKGTIPLENFQGKENRRGIDCFFGCFNLVNYNQISSDWGGGYVISGKNTYTLNGVLNEYFTLQFDTDIIGGPEKFDITYSANALPSGFAVSENGIFSGSSTKIINGTFKIQAKWNNVTIKTINVTLNIAKESAVIVKDTVGLKIGDKFIKIVV